MGSDSDLPVVEKAINVLKDFDIPFEVHIYSAHRTPEQARAFALDARKNGYGALICAAGMAAHLAGAIAANTTIPVIGIPIKCSLDGLDALLSTVQMPSGIPVATVAINGAANAAFLAAEIISLTDDALAAKLDARRKADADAVLAKDAKVAEQYNELDYFQEVFMGGFFGAVLKEDAISDVFFGTDYHSHLGTRRAGIAAYDTELGMQRKIHSIQNSPFRTKFEHVYDDTKGTAAIGCISDYDPQPLLVRSRHGTCAICFVGAINNAKELIDKYLLNNSGQFLAMNGGGINNTEIVAALINQKERFVDGIKFAQEQIDGSASILILTEKGKSCIHKQCGHGQSRKGGLLSHQKQISQEQNKPGIKKRCSIASQLKIIRN